MNSQNANLALTLLLSLLDRASKVGATIRTAQTEGRDITDAEIEAQMNEYRLADAQLTIDIAAKRAAQAQVG